MKIASHAFTWKILTCSAKINSFFTARFAESSLWGELPCASLIEVLQNFASQLQLPEPKEQRFAHRRHCAQAWNSELKSSPGPAILLDMLGGHAKSLVCRSLKTQKCYESLNPLSAIWWIYPVIKMIISVAVWWIYPSWVNDKLQAWKGLGHSRMFGRGSQGTIFVWSSKLSLSFLELCSCWRFLRFPCFSKIWRQTFERCEFWFRRCLGVLFETSLHHRAFYCELRLRPRVVFEITLLFSKQSRCYVPQSYGDPQAEQRLWWRSAYVEN